MPLSIAPQGKKIYIQKIGGSRDTKRHLGSLGFIPGSELTIISTNSGNIIVNIHDTRIALNQSLANKIIISQCKNGGNL